MQQNIGEEYDGWYTPALIAHRNPDFRAHAAEIGKEAEWERLIHDRSPIVRATIAMYGTEPYRRRLLKDAHQTVRCMVARHGNADTRREMVKQGEADKEVLLEIAKKSAEQQEIWLLRMLLNGEYPNAVKYAIIEKGGRALVDYAAGHPQAQVRGLAIPFAGRKQLAKLMQDAELSETDRALAQMEYFLKDEELEETETEMEDKQMNNDGRDFLRAKVIAAYEEVFRIEPAYTQWFGDEHFHIFKRDLFETDVEKRFQDALEALGKTEEIVKKDKDYIYHENLIVDMCLKNNVPIPAYIAEDAETKERVQAYTKKNAVVQEKEKNLKKRLQTKRKCSLMKLLPYMRRCMQAESLRSLCTLPHSGPQWGLQTRHCSTTIGQTPQR